MLKATGWPDKIVLKVEEKRALNVQTFLLFLFIFLKNLSS
jgi:hypothetical protein